MGKRVYCLYRVSTKGQVEKDDIPMQKQRCREFAAGKGQQQRLAHPPAAIGTVNRMA